MIPRTTPEEAILDAIREVTRGLWTQLPARIVSVDLAASQATVQPIPADYLAGEAVDLPQIPDVPIMWPQAGGAVFTMPLEPGDMVTLLFAARPVERYRDDGSEGDPQSIRTHSLSDAMILLGGLQPDASAPAASTSHVVLSAPSGGQVRLGAATGTAAVARDGDNADATIATAPHVNGAWDAWFQALASFSGTGALYTAAKATPIRAEVSASSTDVEAS